MVVQRAVDEDEVLGRGPEGRGRGKIADEDVGVKESVEALAAVISEIDII